MSLSRVRYRERQVLRRADLSTEQAYHIAMRRRHNVGPHGWGIVQRLELEGRGDGFALGQGLAVDGFGRELIVAGPIFVPWRQADGAALDERLSSPLVDVWLEYATGSETPPFRGRREQGYRARLREEVRIRLTPGKADAPIDPWAIGEIALADWGFTAAGDPPDDPARLWPVYLGRVVWADQACKIVDARRPYAALRGVRIDAPQIRSGALLAAQAAGGAASAPGDRRASMQIGAERPGDRRRFVVSVGFGPGPLVDRLVIERDHSADFYGPVAIAGARLHLGDREAAFDLDDLDDPNALLAQLRRPAGYEAARVAGQLSSALQARLAARRKSDPGLAVDLLAELRGLLAREFPLLPAGVFVAARGWRYIEGDFADLPGLLSRLGPTANEPCRYLRACLGPAVGALIDAYSGGEPSEELRRALLARLNTIVARMLAGLLRELFADTPGDAPAPDPFARELLRMPEEALRNLRAGASGEPASYHYLLQRLSPELRARCLAYQGGRPDDDLVTGLAVELRMLAEQLHLYAWDALREALLDPRTKQLKDLKAVFEALKARRGTLAAHLRPELKPARLEAIDRQSFEQLSDTQRAELSSDILGVLSVMEPSQPVTPARRSVMEPRQWVTPARLARIYLGDERYGLFGEDVDGVDQVILNRLRLQATFGGAFRPRPFAGVELGALPIAPAEAAPRQLYRVEAAQSPGAHELRFEIENPGGAGDPAAHAFVVGGYNNELGSFRPCLSVGADGNVICYGDLRVEGLVIESPIAADLDDERFVANQTALELATSVDTSSVQATISGVTLVNPGTENLLLTYTVTLINQSPAQITNLEVYETLIESGKTTRLSAQLALETDVLEGMVEATDDEGVAATDSSLTITQRVQLATAPDSRSYLIITAIGISAALNIVYASSNVRLDEAITRT